MAAELLVRQSLDREGGFEKARFDFPSDQPQPPLLKKPVPIHQVLDPLQYPLFTKYVLYGGVELPGIPVMPMGVLDWFVEQQRKKGHERYRENGDPAAWIYGGRQTPAAPGDMNKGVFSGERGFDLSQREWFVVCRFHAVPRYFEYQPWTEEDEAEAEESKAAQARGSAITLDYLVPA